MIAEARTLNNIPYPASVEFYFGAQPGELLIEVLVADRNLELHGDTVTLSGLQIGESQRAATNVDGLSDRLRGSSVQSLSVTGSRTQKISVRMDLSDVLDTARLGGFYYALEVTDRDGNTGRIEGRGRVVEGLSAGASGFAYASAGGCGQKIRSESSALSLILAFAMAVGLLLLRRRRLAFGR